MGSVGTQIDSFGVALPPEWVVFSLESGDFETFVGGQRNRLQREGAQLSDVAVRRLGLFEQQLRNDAKKSNVKLLSMTLAAVESGESERTTLDDTGNEVSSDVKVGQSLVAASCVISTLSREELGSKVSLTVENMVTALTSNKGSEGHNLQVEDLEQPEAVELLVGKAAKIIRLHTHSSSSGELALLVQHFLVPTSVEGDEAAVVSFTTPSVEYARQLSSLFDAMAETFRLFSGDDATNPLSVGTAETSTPSPV